MLKKSKIDLIINRQTDYIKLINAKCILIELSTNNIINLKIVKLLLKFKLLSKC